MGTAKDNSGVVWIMWHSSEDYGSRLVAVETHDKYHLYISEEFIEFVKGRTGPQKTRAPGPVPRPAPLNGLGRGVFFGIPCPCPCSGPRPTHPPDGFPLMIVVTNRSRPVNECRWAPGGGGAGITLKIPPQALCKGASWCVKTRPARPCNEH